MTAELAPRRRRRRVAYVMPGGLGGLTAREALDRWPDTPHLLAKLARCGDLDVTAYWRCPVGQPAEAFTRDGVRFSFIPDGTRLGRRLAAAVAANDPDIVHVNGLVFPLLTVLLRARVGRHARILVQHHGESPGPRRRTRAAQRLAAAAVDGYLFTGGVAQARVWQEARLILHGRTVFDVLEASSVFQPAPQEAARRATGVDGDPAVIWVGRLVEGKDPLTALAGFARFVERGAPAARLWMVCSDRTLGRAVAATIETSAALRDRVHVVGPVPHGEVASWLSAADLFLSTSRHEGSGYALIEALACGCTPVVTDLPSHVAIAGPVGRRFPPGDPDALARALADAPRGPAARTVARRSFDERLTWDAVVDQLLVAYGIRAIDAGGPKNFPKSGHDVLLKVGV